MPVGAFIPGVEASRNRMYQSPTFDPIRLVLVPGKWPRDCTWSTHAAVALPRGCASQADSFELFENGHLIPAQIEAVATWSKDAEPKWLHVYAAFRYRNGLPLNYELRKLRTKTL